MSRTYHSVNVSIEQQEFQKLLADYEVDIFSISEIGKMLNHSFVNLNAILENLENKGFLSRIEQGKYCLANFRDEKVIGSFISGNGAIAYWSALNSHGLTEQFPNTLFIQTDKVKKNKVIFGTSYKFVKLIPQKLTGINKVGFGSRTYNITDIEKTIIDCFDCPQYSGGYAELIRAFNQAKLNNEKMIAYCKTINNIAATKRMGFLAELLDKKGLKTFIHYAREKVNLRYNIFDPMGIDKGEFVNNWRLRLNITRDEIIGICNKQY
jgi:predicted transcriptional regulator of viral defense system